MHLPPRCECHRTIVTPLSIVFFLKISGHLGICRSMRYPQAIEPTANTAFEFGCHLSDSSLVLNTLIIAQIEMQNLENFGLTNIANLAIPAKIEIMAIWKTKSGTLN
jgi:hypothetical protein